MSVSLGRLIPDSPADQSGLLYMYDELLAVNNTDVSRMDHADIVGLIKSSGVSIQLTVQQPEDIDLIVRQQMVKSNCMHSWLKLNNNIAPSNSYPYSK